MKKRLSIKLMTVILAALVAFLSPVQSLAMTNTGNGECAECTTSEGVYGTTGYDISKYLCDVKDLCTGTTTAMKGKPAVIIFGGIGTCYNTKAALGYTNQFIAETDSSTWNVFAFDIKKNSDSLITQTIVDMGAKGKIVTASLTANNTYYNLYSKCLYAAGISGTWTMPLISFVDKDGKVIKSLTGLQERATIKDSIKALGIEFKSGSELTGGSDVALVDGKAAYDVAWRIFDLVNQERAKEGLPALTMDIDLLDAAMLRSAECSVFYDAAHRRPTGEECFTVHDKVYGENIAYMSGYDSYTADEVAAKVMNMWMNSTGHRANILRSTFNSIGVGVFYNGTGSIFFSQDFGSEEIASATRDESVKNYRFVMNIDMDILDYVETEKLEGGATHVFFFPTGEGNVFVNTSAIITKSGSNTSGETGNNSGSTGNSGNNNSGNTGGSNDSGNGNNNSGNNTSTDVEKTYTGLAASSDGNWYLYEDGKVATGYNDLYGDANYGWWKVTNGKVDFDYTGLYGSPTCGWWLIAGGRVAFEYNDLWGDANYGWWKVSGGAVDFGYTGLYGSPTCGWWLIGGGQVAFNYNDLWGDPNYGWWKVVGGTIDFGYNGYYSSPVYGTWNISGGAVVF